MLGNCMDWIHSEFTLLLKFLDNSWNLNTFFQGPGKFLENSIYSTYSWKTPGILRKRARENVEEMKLLSATLTFSQTWQITFSNSRQKGHEIPKFFVLVFLLLYPETTGNHLECHYLSAVWALCTGLLLIISHRHCATIIALFFKWHLV